MPATTNTRTLDATPEQVWDVLADGWLYPLWVVGATRMREVEDAWPAEGSRLHHSFGVWPALINDSTQVLTSEPPRTLRLRARGWPMGEAEVLIELTPAGPGTEVKITEKAVSGPGAYVPYVVEGPLMKWRNSETLRRLAYVAERRVAR